MNDIAKQTLMNRFDSRLAAAYWLLAALVVLAGCGPDGPEVVAVQGKVTRNGQPVPNLFINFMPDSGRPSWAVSGPNGEFEIEYSNEQKGARIGNHKVWIMYKEGRPKDPGEEAERIAKGIVAGPPKELQAILEKYGTQEKALAIEIKRGEFLELKLD